MSHIVTVGDRIEFTGEAKTKANIRGDMLPERMSSIDWFDQAALDATNDYVQTLGGTSDAGAVCGAGESGLLLTTGTGDNEVSFLATPLIFDISNSPTIEAKFNISDVSGTFLYFGFADATTETTPAATIDADSATLTAVATDAVGFVVDADLGGSSIYCASSNTGAAVQSVDTGLDWADGISHTLRVSLDSSGNAKFFVDGIQKGYIALAVADVAAGLCAMVNYGTRAADGANTVYMRYLAKFQDVP